MANTRKRKSGGKVRKEDRKALQNWNTLPLLRTVIIEVLKDLEAACEGCLSGPAAAWLFQQHRKSLETIKDE